MFERLRAAIEAALDAHTPPPDRRERVAQMREAVIEARAAVEGMRVGITKTEGELAAQQKALQDAERRGQLAAGIDDAETAAVAAEFAAKHRARVDVLQDKLEAQRGELELAEKELGSMKAQLKEAGSGDAAEAAWREIEAAGGTRPETDLKDELLRSQLDRAAREARAEAKLDELKKKMGR